MLPDPEHGPASVDELRCMLARTPGLDAQLSTTGPIGLSDLTEEPGGAPSCGTPQRRTGPASGRFVGQPRYHRRCAAGLGRH